MEFLGPCQSRTSHNYRVTWQHEAVVIDWSEYRRAGRRQTAEINPASKAAAILIVTRRPLFFMYVYALSVMETSISAPLPRHSSQNLLHPKAVPKAKPAEGGSAWVKTSYVCTLTDPSVKTGMEHTATLTSILFLGINDSEVLHRNTSLHTISLAGTSWEACKWIRQA